MTAVEKALGLIVVVVVVHKQNLKAKEEIVDDFFSFIFLPTTIYTIMIIPFIMLLKKTCLRCGHKWVQRVEHDPVSCPRCKSPYWNRPRKNNIKHEG